MSVVSPLGGAGERVGQPLNPIDGQPILITAFSSLECMKSNLNSDCCWYQMSTTHTKRTAAFHMAMARQPFAPMEPRSPSHTQYHCECRCILTLSAKPFNCISVYWRVIVQKSLLVADHHTPLSSISLFSNNWILSNKLRCQRFFLYVN